MSLHPGRSRILTGAAARPPAAPRLVTINVGGCRVRLAWAALARCPLGRLARLRACRGRAELLRVCDDYDAARDEFFFDRSACAFRAIVALLRAGTLRLGRGPCALAFRDELAYWGVDEARLERCCRRRLRQQERAAAAARAREGAGARAREGAGARARDGPGARAPDGPGARAPGSRRRLLDVVDDPRAGPVGKLFACVSVAFVAATAVGLCLSTMPDMRAEEERGECSAKCRGLFVLETVCVAWFSLELLLRSLRAESTCAFLRAPLNVVDALALLPFYASLLAGAGAGARAPGRAGLALRLLRALSVLRLARHSLGLRSLGLTARRAARELAQLLLFLGVGVALFAPLVHLAERELGARRDFSSVPASYWWAVISMTTVGYGDMVPRSLPGQVVALSSILSGILLVALPVTSIFHTFSRSYSELREQQREAAERARGPGRGTARPLEGPPRCPGAQGPSPQCCCSVSTVGAAQDLGRGQGRCGLRAGVPVGTGF